MIQGIFGYLKHLSSQVSILKLAVQELLCGDYLRKRLKIRLLVINVHLDHISAHARLAGMTVILEELHDKIAQYPTLLMGDFNAESGKRFINLFKKFQDSKNLATHYGPRGTFQNFTYTKPWAELEEIDYIYVKGWQVQQTASLTDSIDGRFPSDHFPLEAEVCIEER